MHGLVRHKTFLNIQEKMSDQHQNTAPKKYKRVLIYCSTKKQLDEILSSLPIIDGYWDAFNDLGKAIEALKNGDYGIVFCESTPLNPADRDLVLAANSKATHIQSFYSSWLTRNDIRASIWNLEESYYFRYTGEEQDVMTVALYSMFTEPSHIRWVNHMQGEFRAMREKMARDKSQTVLLTGANGTGKFSLSQISHIRSLRRNNRFVFANCKMMAEKPVMKWGAKEKSQFRHILRSMAKDAQSGTLYFHEIDHLDIEAQELIADFLTKDLKVNTDKSQFNGIVICSSRVYIEDNIPGHICSSEIIQILRRNVIRVPSLTEYNDDLELLALEILKNYCMTMNIPQKVFTKEALKIIVEHVWSRNLRELFDVIKHAILTSPNKRITADSIVLHPIVDNDDNHLDKLRKVRQALRESNGNKRKAAKELEIAPKTLYAWMKELGIPLDYK